MRLKKLEIQGFKSFADRTAILFGSGMTAVVGPNGCGKSNIVDAIKWVTGEQSAKSLRGDKMNDVIFAGTPHRKAMGYAQVVLTLEDEENESGLGCTEIEIIRKVYASGESDFYINKRGVRLKDIQNIFWETGVGKEAISVFEQGKVDQIVTMSPLDRRRVFERAAKIIRFIERKKESLKKLEQTTKNLNRLKDLYGELESIVKKLKDQAEKALVYKERRFQLQILEKSLLAEKSKQLQGFLGKNQLRLQELEEKKRGKSQKKQEIEFQIVQLEETLQELVELEKEQKEGIHLLHTEKKLLQNNLEQSSAKVEEYQQQLLKLEKERRRLVEEQEEELADYQKEHESLKALQTKLIEKQKEENASQQHLKSYQSQLQEYLEKERELNQSRISILSEENKWKGQLVHAKKQLDNCRERTYELNQKKAQYSDRLKDLDHLKEDKREKICQLELDIENLKKAQAVLIENIATTQEKLNQFKTELSQLGHLRTEHKARIHVLLKLKQDFEGFSPGAKVLLTESACPDSVLYQKISPLFEKLGLSSDNRPLMFTALSQYAQTLVVKTKEDLKQVIEIAREKKCHGFSIICLELLQDSFSQDSRISFKSLMQNEDVPLLKHFLKEVYYLDPSNSIEELLEWAKNHSQTVVLDTSLILDHKSVLVDIHQNSQQVFQREKELIRLNEALEQVEKKLHVVEEKVEEIHLELQSKKNERQEKEKALRKGEILLVEWNFEFEKNMSEKDRIVADLNQIEEQTRRLENQMIALEKEEKASENQIVQTHQKNQKVTEDIQTLQKDMALSKKMVEEMHVLYEKNMREVHNFENQVKQVEKNIEIYHIHQSQREERSLQIEEGSYEVQAAIQKMEQKLIEWKTILASKEEALQQLVGQSKDHEHVMEDKKQKHLNLLSDKEANANEMNQLHIQLNEVEARKLHLQEKIQELENEVMQNYQATVIELEKMAEPLSVSLSEAEKKVRQLRRELDETEDVNLSAIEEFEKENARFELMQSQIEDLDRSKEELLELIKELDQESRIKFQTAFEKIRANFKKNFAVLFEGGQADLHFTDSDDLLEAGIEIMAQPPGKKMRSITLLSGGEKCLTSMALLFSIFELNPAPFCLLDEIDAPLDDANVARFVKLLKEFVHNTQFIVITHNKCTMSQADTLIGISMEERGITKVLSLKFSKPSAATKEQVLIEV